MTPHFATITDLEGISTPWTALWTSVLITAIEDMDSRNVETAALARCWLWDERTGVGSFLWICEMLDLDVQRLQIACRSEESRRALLRKDPTTRWIVAETE